MISTIPLRDLVLGLDPSAPAHVLDAARRLRYRHMCVVALITEEQRPFPDNWIYLHDTNALAGRVQNFGAWSADMVLPGTTCLGVEYYCSEDDEVWTMDHRDAVEFAKADLARIGLIDPTRVIDGVKIRVPVAYPLYDSCYAESVRTIRRYLEEFENLQTCGRNGLHRHNNQDHSVWTGLLAARNLLDGTNDDVWDVDVDEHQPAARQLAPLLVNDIRLVST